MKNRVIYGVREEIYRIDGGVRRGYGIVAYARSGEDTVSTVVAAVSDVTSDEEKLLDLVRLCNDLALDPRHLHDVVEDFLCG